MTARVGPHSHTCASRARRSLQGTWIGTKSDHLSMKVAVKVGAAAAAETGRGTSVAREF